MNVSKTVDRNSTHQTMGMEAIFLHTQECEQRAAKTCNDLDYWGGSMSLEEIAGGRSSSLYRVAQRIQSHHGLSYGA